MTQSSEGKSASEPTPVARKLSEKQQHQLRTAQAMSRRAEKSKGELGWPKRRKPSMPPTPWDKDAE